MKITGKRIGYGILFLFFAVAFLVLQSYAALVILLILIIMPLVSVVLCKVAYSGLSFEINTTDANLEKDLPFPVLFHIKNTSMIPILDCAITVSWQNGFSQEVESATISAPVYARGNQILRLPVRSHYCGVISFRVTKVQIRDYLSLYSLEKKVETIGQVVIYPVAKEGIKVNTKALVSGNDDAEESHTKGSDFSEVSNVREYVPGDNLKDIHWKLSVKKEELMVKEHVTLSAKQIAILIELYNDKDFILDRILGQAYSAAYSLVNTSQAFTLYWWSAMSGKIKEKPVQSASDLEHAFHELLFEKPYNTRDKGKEEFALTEYRNNQVIWIRDGENMEVSEVDCL